MENFGLKIAEGSEITNLTVPSGTAFPANDNVGEMFYRTDLDTMYVRNNTGWEISGSSSKNKNVMINGNFDIWQRGISQTSSGMDTDDRWFNTNSTTTKTHSRQAFVLGQTDVPNNPQYYSRTVVASVAGAGNYGIKYQKIENVSTFAGETVTLSFWAKADSNKNIAAEFAQGFGTGGSPSSGVQNIGTTTFALTSTWQQFTTTISLPSISGKTLGTNNNDFLQMVFWFEAGSDFDGRTNSLGQQSGTFDIAQVQLEKGTTATEFEHRSEGEELALCQRYYCFGNTIFFCYGVVGNGGYSAAIYFPMEMRAYPSFISVNIGSSGTFIGNTVNDKHNAIMTLVANVSGQQTINRSWTADAEI